MTTRSQAHVRHSGRAAERHLLHVFASFGLGGVPIRICEVINGLPPGFRHTIVALDGCFDARRRLDSHTSIEFQTVACPRYNVLRSFAKIRHLMNHVSPDLLLTYNWGAIEVALANRCLGACDHIHFESGFGAEEGDGQIWRRNVFRRIALSRVNQLVVPSATLMKIARESWKVPEAKVRLIVNGVDCARFSGQPGQREDGRFGEVDRRLTVIGTVAPLRPEKNVGRLLRAFAGLPERQDCAMVVAGDGVEMGTLQTLAGRLGIARQVRFLGHVEDVPAVLRGIDVFALSSDTEQMPNSLLQAMAAGRPVAAVDVGDVARIVAPQNRPLVVARDSEAALTGALATLASDAALRRDLGRANQDRVRSHYGIEAMVAAYSRLFSAG